MEDLPKEGAHWTEGTCWREEMRRRGGKNGKIPKEMRV